MEDGLLRKYKISKITGIGLTDTESYICEMLDRTLLNFVKSSSKEKFCIKSDTEYFMCSENEYILLEYSPTDKILRIHQILLDKLLYDSNLKSPLHQKFLKMDLNIKYLIYIWMSHIYDLEILYWV